MTEERAGRVRRLLLERGVAEELIDEAFAAGRIALLVMDHLSVPDGPRYTPEQVAETAGLSFDLTSRLWRALGFPAVPAGEADFTDFDLDALATLNRLLDQGFVDPDTAVQFARVIGSGMSKIAQAEVSLQPAIRPTDLESIEFADALLSSSDNLFDLLADLLVYAWRRHLQASVRRAMVAEHLDETGALVSLAVGFADLVGYTALSQQISEEALGALVSRFEQIAHDAVTAAGGRVVKMIGDEVMFVADDTRAAAEIALNLADVFADDDILSDVRVGLAHGAVLGQEGDYYGPVVNLASRLVNIAYPGTVVVSADIHDEFAADPDLGWRSLRSRHLKDIGDVPLWVMHRAGEEPRSGRRRFRPLRTLLSEAGFQRAENPTPR